MLPTITPASSDLSNVAYLDQANVFTEAQTINGALDVDGKIAIDGTARTYYPDQTSFPGTMYIGNGDGGASLSHTTGEQGYYNTFIGIGSGNSNTTGARNTANGYHSLYSNTTGARNTANGCCSLCANTTGAQNTANGMYSLNANTTGNFNTANGYSSLNLNTTGAQNTANGYASLRSNTTGNYNTANGYDAGRFITGGSTANQTSLNSIYLGAETKAKADGDDNEIVIGYDTTGNGSNTVTLGNDSITDTLLKGNVGIGTSTPGSKLAVVGLPTASTSLSAGDFFTQTSAQLGGSGTTKVVCVV